jgi:hypothetical protein
MGYRNYVASLPRKIYEEAKDLTAEELGKKYAPDEEQEDDEYFYFDDRDSLPGFEELHCFGKYCDFGIKSSRVLPRSN